MTTFGQEGRPAPTGTVRVERRAAWLALVVVAVLLGGCASPTGGGSPGTGSGSVPTAISSLAPSASVAGATPSSSAVPSVEAAIGQPADDGARITGLDRLGPRSRDITIDSPAVGIRTVRLLVPASFETQTTRRWPVLYLLHGATGSHSDWMEYTDVEALTNATDLIIAMPDGGEFGFYSDWWNGGSGGVPMWETFHTMELPQLLERNWHASDKRVVAGLSMGGYGALEYAARFPGTYLAAASYSGAVDPIGGELDIGTTDLWGDPVAQADIWKAHDPVRIAEGLKGTKLYVSYGDGGAGPLDMGTVPNDDLEGWIAAQNRTLVDQLRKLKIPVTVDAYGPGSHDWPYWERALHRSLPMLLKALGE